MVAVATRLKDAYWYLLQGLTLIFVGYAPADHDYVGLDEVVGAWTDEGVTYYDKVLVLIVDEDAADEDWRVETLVEGLNRALNQKCSLVVRAAEPDRANAKLLSYVHPDDKMRYGGYTQFHDGALTVAFDTTIDKGTYVTAKFV